MAHVDSPTNTDGPARKPRRYRLVMSRAEARGARIKRFQLSHMEALSRLEPRAGTARPAR
jgi:hypothetical protein